MKIKTLLFLLFLALSANSFSQRVRGFGGFGYYRNTQFEKSGYASIDVGLEFKAYKILKPEIKATYFLVALQDKTTTDANGVETDFLTRTVTASNISLSPKICFGDEDETVHLQIIPMFNLTKVIAQGSFFVLDNDKTQFIKKDSDKYSEIRHSFGLGMGVLLDLSDDTFQSIALNLYFNNIEFGNAISNLKFKKGNLQSYQTLGIGIKYYFGFVKKKNTNK
jgi:hypothetical protein